MSKLQSVNEVMPKRYQLLKDGKGSIYETQDLGKMNDYINEHLENKRGTFQVIDSLNSEVLRTITKAE